MRVAAHEVGHLADGLAGEFLGMYRGRVDRGIPAEVPGNPPAANDRLLRELQVIYHDLNDISGRSGPGVRLRRNQLWGPQNSGYVGPEVHREYFAEAFRAYFENPTTSIPWRPTSPGC